MYSWLRSPDFSRLKIFSYDTTDLARFTNACRYKMFYTATLMAL